jgi:epoxyqueuosine reductase QueG
VLKLKKKRGEGRVTEEKIAKIMSNEKIEYYATVPFESLAVTKPHLLRRLDFEPKTALVFLVPYFVGHGENISSYAVSRDYHIFLSALGEKIGKALRESGFSSAEFGDHSPIDERDAAELADLGQIGKSGMLINELYGTFVFIGEVLTDADLHIKAPKKSHAPRLCTECGACIDSCPKHTHGVCLSALTQKKGDLCTSEIELISKHATAWGCDICQRVCPANIDPVKTPISFFHESLLPRLDTDIVRGMSEDEFSCRAYSWRGRDVLLRNLEILGQPRGHVEK